ncbi:MAG: type IV secretion system protein [Desulfobacteraceae bacterium]|nr:type IV secretion system protein [Desulfobacteraceae bacterium]
MQTYEYFYGKILLNLWRKFQEVLNVYLIDILSEIPFVFKDLAVVLTIFYILYIIIQTWFGRLEKPKEAVMTAFLLILCNSLVFDSLTYLDWVKEPFEDLTYKLAGFFITAEVHSETAQLFGVQACFAQIGGLLDQTFQFCFNIEPSGSLIWNAWKYFENGMAFVLLIAPVLVYSITYFVLCSISLFMSYILWVVGPIFLFCFCFKGARGYFKNWATALINYALIIIFASLVVGITSSIIGQSMKDLYAQTGDFRWVFFTSEYWFVFFMNLLSIGLLLKVPDIAANLSGGQAGSTAGITGGLSAIGGLAASGGAMAMAKGGAFAGKASAAAGGMGRGAYSRFAPPGVRNVINRASAMSQSRRDQLMK